MRSRKFLAVGICGVVGLGLASSVSAANTSNNPVPVTYDYSGTAEPVSPNYAISIPTGLVFDARNPSNSLKIDVEMKAPQGQSAITAPSKADVSVKSANEYMVQLADGSDAIKYTVEYGGVVLSGATSKKIGTLAKDAPSTTDCLKIEGSAKLNGVATKTGAHVDTLTYTIEDQSTASGS